MYIAQQKADGELVEGVFSAEAMKNMRAHVLCGSINEGDGSWEKEEQDKEVMRNLSFCFI